MKTSCIALCLSCFCCPVNVATLSPQLDFAVQDKYIDQLPSPFLPLNEEEKRTDWGKEHRIAYAFAKQLDLYAAIQGFKRAAILIPTRETTRLREIEYHKIFCYFLGKKYEDVIYTFEHSSLLHADDTFVAYQDLLTMLFEAYYKTKDFERAKWIVQTMTRYFPSAGKRLSLTHAFYTAEMPILEKISRDPVPRHALEEILTSMYRQSKDIQGAAFSLITNAYKEDSSNDVFEQLDDQLVEQVRYLAQYTAAQEETTQFVHSYQKHKKSPLTAQFLNGVLPGAGYWYIEQKQTAFTALVLNSLFTWGAVHFFRQGNLPAAILTTSFELGWYIGGIQGAYQGASLYNERLYEQSAHQTLREHRLYPLLMLGYGF